MVTAEQLTDLVKEIVVVLADVAVPVERAVLAARAARGESADLVVLAELVVLVALAERAVSVNPAERAVSANRAELVVLVNRAEPAVGPAVVRARIVLGADPASLLPVRLAAAAIKSVTAAHHRDRVRLLRVAEDLVVEVEITLEQAAPEAAIAWAAAGTAAAAVVADAAADAVVVVAAVAVVVADVVRQRCKEKKP
jgi:hypothetical protein